MVMTGADGLAENVTRQWVTSGFFDVLGIQPIAGRTFLAETTTPSGANVVVLSETFWRTRFDADPAIVGRELRLRRHALHRGRRRAAGVSAAGRDAACGRSVRFTGAPPRLAGCIGFARSGG